MFNKIIDNNKIDDSPGQSSQDLNRGLALLIVITMSVVGSSWLFSVPVYFDLKIALQVLPLLYSTIILFSVTRLQSRYLNVVVAPLSYLVIFSSWSYVVFLNAGVQQDDIKDVSALLTGFSNSMYLLGLCLITIWLGRYFKYSIYLSPIATVSIFALLFVFTKLPLTFLFAIALLLVGCIIVAHISFKAEILPAELPVNQLDVVEEDLLLPSEEELVPELEINSLPLNEASVRHDWELILRELHGELKNTADVDQLFKRMLVFLHGAMEYDSAAVGMLQEKSLKKIATFGDDEFLHTQTLNWTNQRVSELFNSREPILSNQVAMSRNAAEKSEAIHRLDIPVVSNQKSVGIVTLFRETLRFDTHDVKLAASIVFHSMVALRQARMQDEIKRLSSNAPVNKLTVYSREQFVEQVKPIFAKLSTPRECSLFILEIDAIDDVVDKIGRDAATVLYKKVSQAISSQIKDSDILGKYGKDGFVVLLDETDMVKAKELAEAVRTSIEKLKVKFQEHVITTTASIGLTIVSDPDDDLPSLMRKADMGLFVAKENGCNTVKVSL